MSTTNGMPVVFNDEQDQGLLGSLFPQGTGASNLQRAANNLTQDSPFEQKNAFAYSPVSKNGKEVKNSFFGSSKSYRFGASEIIVDPSSGIDPKEKIKVIERGFYNDRNNNNIQDADEAYVVTIKLFISKMRDDLDKIYKDPTVIPNPKEILFFLEDNSGDWSGTTLYIKKGKDVNATLTKFLSDSNTFKDYIKSQYNISIADLKELLEKGEVKNKVLDIISCVFEIASFFVTNPAVLKGIAVSIKKAAEAIKETCSIDEKNWNPEKTEKGKTFQPFLFPGNINVVDGMDDKKANALVNMGVKNLRKEIDAYDKKIETVLNLVSDIRLPLILPFGPVTIPLKVPDTFSELLLMKYGHLRKTIDKALIQLEGIDLSSVLKEGANIINAFICGLWNGFIEAICGIISLVQYLFEGAELIADLLRNFKEKGPLLLEKIDDITTAFHNLDFGKIFTKLASDVKVLLSSGTTVSLVELAYFSGMFVGFVVELAIEIAVGILFTGGTLSIEAVIAKIGETFKALASLVTGTLKGLYKAGEKTLAALIKGFDWLLEFLSKGTDEIIKLIDEVFVKFKTLQNEVIVIDKIDDILIPLIKVLKQNPSYLKCISLVNENRVFGRWIVIEAEAMVKLYTANTYIILNKALRGIGSVKLDKELKAMQKVLDDALEKLPISKYNNEVLQRSAFFSEKEIKKLFKAGSDFIEKGFMSTTYSERSLKNWLVSNPDHNVVFKVFGKNGKLIEEASLLREEAEVLFKSGTAFTVKSVKPITHPVDRSREVMEIILIEK